MEFVDAEPAKPLPPGARRASERDATSAPPTVPVIGPWEARCNVAAPLRAVVASLRSDMLCARVSVFGCQNTRHLGGGTSKSHESDRRCAGRTAAPGDVPGRAAARISRAMGFFSPGRKKKATEEARGADGDVGNTEVASTISAPARTTDDAPRQRVSLDRHAALPPVVAPKTITSCITADHEGAWRFQTSTVVVHNPGPAPVLFKVKALRPDDVFVKPNQGAIAAGDDIELTLTFKPPNGVEDERPRPNELAVMSLACDAGHSLPCDPSVEQPPGVFVSRAFDAADPSRVFPARKVTIHFDTGVSNTVRAATEAMETAARRRAAEAVAGAMAAFGAKRRVAEMARRFGCVWRAVARTRALARQG